ncbi:Uncharacterised protein [Mycobacterium tuberculosis]|nr:Uncharacterised protein [Mycobacterium tuberculosis]
MQGHQGNHTRAMLRDLIGVGDQRHPFQKIRQHTGVGDVFVVWAKCGGILPVGTEFVCDAD